MKDSLLEMLMNFFEKSLSQLKENKSQQKTEQTPVVEETELTDSRNLEDSTLVIRSAKQHATRVFTSDEQLKFTKASYQFLMRIMLWKVINPETLEQIINQLLFSDSRFVTLQETKWTIRNTLAEHLDPSQLAFLDLVLYQKEDELPLH
ncbi:DUF494 family protein [Legionella spiritensis]|uniref:DUF494 family protein n=1 Tax=Legionella spiritensis TaxID=452 RepID=UPI000F6EEA75|nr:DUF494 family protein [Legionella spiritensis]VEG91306.1 Uncharacterized protein conserved in bacteria [Legionella spiritensis]